MKTAQEKYCHDGTHELVLQRILDNELLKTNSSGCTGIHWDSTRQKWRAHIIFKGKGYFLGRYDKKEDAIEARKTAEKELFSKFLNDTSDLKK